MLFSIGRAAIRRVGAGQFHNSLVRVGERTQQAQCVYVALSSCDGAKIHSKHESLLAHSLCRSYATTSNTTPKPRAKVKTASEEKPVTARKSSSKTAKKATTKPKAKPREKKIVVKHAKKVLTEAQKIKRAEVKAREELKALKATALLSPPKALPATAWTVLITEEMKSHKGEGYPGATKVMADAAERYKNLDPSERERLNHIANQNKLTNEATLSAWVESHTPEEIRAANGSRLILKRRIGKSKSAKFSPIKDPRGPKKPRSARAIFIIERWASGDLKGISFVDASKTLNDEWHALPADDKKHFEDVAATEKAHYLQEYRTVFHRDPPTHHKATATA